MFKFSPIPLFAARNVSIDGMQDSICRSSPSPSVAVHTVYFVALQLMLEFFLVRVFKYGAGNCCQSGLLHCIAGESDFFQKLVLELVWLMSFKL